MRFGSLSVRRWVPTDASHATVAAGDVLAIVLFVILGEIRHGVDPVGQPLVVIQVLVPFLIGWAAIVLPVEVYLRPVREATRLGLLWVVPAWAGACVIAQLLRATAVFRGNADLAFFLVSVGIGGAFVLSWRGLLALGSARPVE